MRLTPGSSARHSAKSLPACDPRRARRGLSPAGPPGQAGRACRSLATWRCRSTGLTAAGRCSPSPQGAPRTRSSGPRRRWPAGTRRPAGRSARRGSSKPVLRVELRDLLDGPALLRRRDLSLSSPVSESATACPTSVMLTTCRTGRPSSAARGAACRRTRTAACCRGAGKSRRWGHSCTAYDVGGRHEFLGSPPERAVEPELMSCHPGLIGAVPRPDMGRYGTASISCA